MLRPSAHVALVRNPRDAPRFTSANLRGANLDGAILPGARGLDSINGRDGVSNSDRARHEQHCCGMSGR